MSFLVAEARFLLDRVFGLIRRGLLSVCARGWRASWLRTRTLLRPVQRSGRAHIYLPMALDGSAFVLATCDTPRASIVIPVYNQCAHTLACLRALSEHPPQVAHEVIVIDDGSTDASQTTLPGITGLTYHRRERNRGFIAACNDGAALAKGEFLAFLNNDTVAQPGWLDALLRTFDDLPGVGLVGAQLLFPDGRLQEAGGIVFNDGSAWNYGRFESPHDPRFSYLRDADYVSAAAIVLPRTLFAEVGGFAECYAPAYYEDTDLAFAIREHGYRVLYQPAARVVHHEGVTAGTDPGTGIKAYQVRNRARFVERHHRSLKRQLPPPTIPTPALLHRHQPQVLIIDALTPTPDHDSGSLRLFNLMRLLRDEGAHVVFLPANLEHAGPHTERLQRQGVEAWYGPFSSRITTWLREHGRRLKTIIVCRYYVAGSFLPLLRKYAPQATIVFDTVDLHYLREQRGAEVNGHRMPAMVAARTRILELDCIAASDITTVVSDRERALLLRESPSARIETLSNLHEIAGPGLAYAERHDLVFVGGFRHPPNVDAVVWFVETVFPLVRAHLPDIRFHCIGGNLTAQIESLGSRPGVHVHGHIMDITQYMSGCRIAVAPLRYGAGVKGKVNFSMAHGQPVVATSCAAEGMHLTHGHDVLVADDAESFAARIVELYLDESLWHRLSANGLVNVERHFSLDAARDKVRELFLEG